MPSTVYLLVTPWNKLVARMGVALQTCKIWIFKLPDGLFNRSTFYRFLLSPSSPGLLWLLLQGHTPLCPCSSQPCGTSHNGRMNLELAWLLNYTWLWHEMKALDTGPAPALSEPQPHRFQDRLQGLVTLEPEECNSVQREPFITSHPPQGASESSYFSGTTRTSLPLVSGKSGLLIPPATKVPDIARVHPYDSI